MMIPPHVLLPLIGAGSAFGASGAVLALMGVGVPFLLAALGASACAGLILLGVAPRPGSTAAQHGVTPARIDGIEAKMASLRHDLRGALSPALIVSDRLTIHADPAVRKAGEAVIRSIERASALLAASRTVDEPAAPPEHQAAPASRMLHPTRCAETGGPAPRRGVGS